jgi:endonuclease-3
LTQGLFACEPMTPKTPTIENIKKVYLVFEENYVHIPLEVFGKNPYKTLISTLLSSRTKDEVTLVASKRLFQTAPNIKKLNIMGQDKIEMLIYPVGFYKTKAKHLKELSKSVLNDFDGNIPKTRNDLMQLSGVGRKTANLVLNRAFGIPAIAVDTHVHRISNILGWVNTKNPEKTELELISFLPKHYWSRTNRLFVSIGRQYTTTKRLNGFLKDKGLV